jgi:glycosyltransferase involved in cell wall biosynthesis
MDVLYIGCQRKPLYRFGVSPTKLNDYMLAAKPIVYAINSINEAIEKSGAGIICRAEDSSDIAAAIKKLYAMSPQEREAIGKKGREWIVAYRNYRVLAERFLRCIGVSGTRQA